MKYIGNTKELLQLSKMVLLAYYNDELILIIIHGKQGYGKSTFAGLISAQVYGVINKINELLDKQPDFKMGPEKEKRRILFREFIKIYPYTLVIKKNYWGYYWIFMQKAKRT